MIYWVAKDRNCNWYKYKEKPISGYSMWADGNVFDKYQPNIDEVHINWKQSLKEIKEEK